MKSSKVAAIRGLYAITPDISDTEQLCLLVQASLLGGAAIVQYRNKNANSRLRIAQARALLPLCREHGVPLIINDNIKLCLAIDADGVHLGSSDGSLAAARERLGEHRILGASCYNNYQAALEARSSGADYIAFGACFTSGTKPGAVKAELDLFRMAKADIKLPRVAIGGITLNNAPQVIHAGASAVAVIGALWNSADIEQTARQFTQLFD